MQKAVDEGNGPFVFHLKGPRLWPSVHFYNLRTQGVQPQPLMPPALLLPLSQLRFEFPRGSRKVLLPSESSF